MPELLVVWAIWNLFLAGLPVALAGPLSRRLASPGGAVGFLLVTAPLGAAWLLLLPNAPYLLTEIRHFVLDDEWRDLTARAGHDASAFRQAAGAGLLFLLYGAAGVVAFVAAVRPVERVLRARFPRLRGGRAALFFLVSLGVWLGLVPRLNSWDAVLRPAEVVATAWGALTHPPTLASILVFGAVLAALSVLADGAWEYGKARGSLWRAVGDGLR